MQYREDKEVPIPTGKVSKVPLDWKGMTDEFELTQDFVKPRVTEARTK